MSKNERLHPPPIEKLSEVSWARVERDLFAALDCDASRPVTLPVRERAWQPWAIAGGLAVACTAAALLLLRPTSSTPVAAPVATDEAPDASGHVSPARLVTQDAPSEVTFGEASIEVDAQSAVTMHGDADRGVLIVLERGAAEFAVAARNGRPPFVVQAGEVMVRVVGTRFEVSRSGDAARVDVTEGQVEVVARGHRVQVRAGESWASSDDREAVVSGQAANPGDVAAAPFSTDAGAVPGGADGHWEAPVRPRPRQPVTSDPQPDPRELFEHAAALEASDPQTALAEYRALARRKGKWAANALYAAGRLAAELGDPSAATLLRSYLKRYPSGANAADAQALLATLE